MILFYSKTSQYVWNQPFTAYDPSYLANFYNHEDGNGKYQLITCSAPGDRTGTRAHYEWRGKLPPPGRHWAWKIDQMEKFEADGRLVYSSNGVPRLKRYVTEGSGVAIQDLWTDIGRLDAHSLERVGYDTQKPTELLERIIAASSSPGDLVIDPFDGSGTTMVAAERLNRSWIGIDQSLLACSLTLCRVRAEVGTAPITLRGFPTNIDAAERFRRESPVGFGIWGVGLMATLPERSLVADDLMVGYGQIRFGKRRVPLVSFVSLNRKGPMTMPDIPTIKVKGLSLILDDQCHQVSRLWDWAQQRYPGTAVRVPLGSAASNEATANGIAPEVLQASSGV